MTEITKSKVSNKYILILLIKVLIPNSRFNLSYPIGRYYFIKPLREHS